MAGLFGCSGHQLTHFRFYQGLLTLLLRIRKPDQALLARIGSRFCVPGGPIGLKPLAVAFQVCGSGIGIHQPAQLRQQLFPLLQLLGALLVSVAELLE